MAKGYSKISKTILFLALPTMAEQLLQAAVGYIDTAMVGSLGANAVAAVGATGSVNWFMHGTVTAIGIGFLSCISRMLGSGDEEKARKAAGQAVIAAAILGLAYTALALGLSGAIPRWMHVDSQIVSLATLYFQITYAPMLFRSASLILSYVIRSGGDTKTPLKVTMAENAINLALNYILIYEPHDVGAFHVYGAGLGVGGAAIASAISYVFGGVAMTLCLFRDKRVSPIGMPWKPDLIILKPCFSVALPIMLQKVSVSSGYIVYASMINALGGVATAAHTVANTVESAFYIPGKGMQATAETLAGYAYGAKSKEDIKRLTKAIIPIEFLLMSASALVLFFAANPLVRIFSDNEDVIMLGTTVLKMISVTEPFFGMQIVIEGILQGLERTKVPFIVNVLGMWCIRILGTFIATRVLGLGFVSAWSCMALHNLFLFFVLSLYFLLSRHGLMKGECE